MVKKMIDQNQTKQDAVSGGISPAVVAGVVALSNENNREKLADAKDQVTGYVEDKVDEVKENIAEDKATVEKVAASVKSSINKGVVDAKKAAGVK
ncbi:MAG: hypothetical protein UU93_C0033G0007 [Candidatus Amesbacteria bacterium GW2011_GWA2_42_12]|uniref:Uncharacterized protein n=1 Tax=Candidatus Amesbacteria bacterium GW2011_GWA2_42_12 TaxID=1618356 RepID=A0A0G1AZK9_9BACT|nr:MAG: hypothetical protein UU93_C0033G0007 [Candidatus Amesbacteria bacterium GW2011_GWA2_42_12]